MLHTTLLNDPDDDVAESVHSINDSGESEQTSQWQHRRSWRGLPFVLFQRLLLEHVFEFFLS